MPAPRTEGSDAHQPGAASHAGTGLAVVRRFAARLDEVVSALDDRSAREASRLPGWNRQHVLSHLARNADALVNLLAWARTGIEHPMYPSRADRDADIEEGAHRLLRVVQEDLTAATDRFYVAADRLPDSAWEASVTGGGGRRVTAAHIPWMRVVELLVHSVDLDRGLTFDQGAELAGEALPAILDQVISGWHGRDDVPGVTIEVTLPGGGRRTWSFGSQGTHQVSGPAGPVLGWLTGRTSDGLTGDVPTLPAWL